MNKNLIPNFVKQSALKIGFGDCEIINAKTLDNQLGYLKNSISLNLNANQQYLAHEPETRINPFVLFPETKSIICLITPYNIGITQHKNSSFKIAKFALVEDYHYAIANKMQELCNELKKEFSMLLYKCCVDTSPILEKAWAHECGLGWIGKNSLFISPKFGSYVFLSEILTNIEVENTPSVHKNLCANCEKCINSCPSKAIISEKIIDCNKCIAYQTIEDKQSSIHDFTASRFNKFVFGCDICQEVCPWNKQENLDESFLKPDCKVLNLTDTEWLNLNQANFSKIFDKSTIKRRKLAFLQRNINYNRTM